MYNNYIVFLTLVFFGITYSFSLLEKLSDWSATTSYYTNHFRNTALSNIVNQSVALVCVLEGMVLITLGKNSYQYYKSSSIEVFDEFLLASAALIIILLIGQRIAKDYQGASSLGTYFIVNLIGIYCL
jgi:hypothetical protein